MNQKDELISHIRKKEYNYKYCTKSSDIVDMIFLTNSEKDPEIHTDVEVSIDKKTGEIISIRNYSDFGERNGCFIYDIVTAKRILSRYMTLTR